MMRITVGIFAALLSAVALTLTVLWLVPVTQTWTTIGAMAASFTGYLSYLWLAVAVAWLASGWSRWWGWTLFGAGALAALLSVQWHFSIYDSNYTPGDLVVVSLNTEFGEADPTQLTKVVAEAEADVIVLLEFTPQLESALTTLGWGNNYPYKVGDATASASGTMVYSRYPLHLDGQGETTFTNLLVTVAAPNQSYQVVAAHPVSPTFDGVQDWVRDAAEVRRLAVAADHPAVAIGDFNAVPQHYTMDELRKAGFASAGSFTKQDIGPTWPQESRLPPLITIDHAMLSGLEATRYQSFTVPGTDHAGLIVEVAVPTGR